MEHGVLNRGGMFRFALLLLLAACASDVDEGTALPPCQECGPGAIRAGRFFSSLGRVVANRSGIVVGATERGLVWLRDHFTVEHSTELQHVNIAIVIDELGGGAAVPLSDEHDPDAWRSSWPVYGFTPDHSIKWTTRVTGLIDTVRASSEIVSLDVFTDSPAALALRASDGSMAWRKPLVRMVLAADGTLIYSKYFSGTLELGGTTTPLAATGNDLVVAGIDRLTGDARWAVMLDDPNEAAQSTRPLTLGVGADGEIAVSWVADGIPVLSLIDATRTVLWTQPSSACGGSLWSLQPYGDKVLAIATPAMTTDDLVVQCSATGLDWQRAITGTGWHGASLLALGSRLIAAISSSTPLGSPPSFKPTTTVGDVTYEGDGVAIVELVY
jgi:hypothetical protein